MFLTWQITCIALFPFWFGPVQRTTWLWLLETIRCPALHCGSGKEPPTSAKGFTLLTALFLLVGKCLSRTASGCKRDGKGKCVKRSSVEAVLWGMRTTFFLKDSHVFAHYKDLLWHTEIILGVFDPAQCLPQALQLTYLIYCWHLCGADTVWLSSRLTCLTVVCFF